MAPAASARSTSARWTDAVMNTRGIARSSGSAFIAAASSNPVIFGIDTSVKTTSGRIRRMSASPSSPSAAVRTSCAVPRNAARMRRWMIASSSQKTTFPTATVSYHTLPAVATWNVIVATPPEAAPVPVAVTSVAVERVATSIDLTAAIDRGTSLVVVDERIASRAGGDLVTAIRQRAKGRDLPIVLLASRQRAGNVLALARSRADAVLFEPIDVRELAYTVARLLQHAAPSPPPKADPGAADLWAESRDEVVARVTAIDGAARAALEDRLTPALRAEARTKAHQLAGSLGVFGLAAAGHHAKAIDDLLGGADALRPEDARRVAELAVALRDAIDAGPSDEAVRPPGPLVTLLVPEGAMRTRVETEARELGVTFTAERDGTDGAIVAVAADPMLLAARTIAATGTPMVIVGMAGSRGERAAASLVPGALYAAPGTDAKQIVGSLLDALARSRGLGGARVLLVDDDPVIHAAVRRILEPSGARVTAIADPLATFDVLEREGADVALLDVDMPGLTGIELCRLIRGDARWSRLVVIFCTASNDPLTIQRVWAAGGDDYVPKPVGPELIARIGARLRTVARGPAPAAHGDAVDVALVEDDEPLARVVTHALEQQGLRVAHIADGRAAIERLAGGALRARVVLLDVGLPGADGFEVLRHLAKSERRPRVIMLTARSAEPEVVRALELGAFDHVAKPFSLPVLIQRVRRAIAEA